MYRQETAINIGIASKLVPDGARIVSITGTSIAECKASMSDGLLEMATNNDRPSVLVVTGDTLDHALHAECVAQFIEISKRCTSVICCR